MKKLVFTQVENTSKQTDVMYFSNFSLRPLALEKQFSPTLRPALISNPLLVFVFFGDFSTHGGVQLGAIDRLITSSATAQPLLV